MEFCYNIETLLMRLSTQPVSLPRSIGSEDWTKWFVTAFLNWVNTKWVRYFWLGERLSRRNHSCQKTIFITSVCQTTSCSHWFRCIQVYFSYLFSRNHLLAKYYKPWSRKRITLRVYDVLLSIGWPMLIKKMKSYPTNKLVYVPNMFFF